MYIRNPIIEIIDDLFKSNAIRRFISVNEIIHFSSIFFAKIPSSMASTIKVLWKRNSVGAKRLMRDNYSKLDED